MQNEIEANKERDTHGGRRLLAAVITQAVQDLNNPKERADSIAFFWGSNSATAKTYLGLLGYDAEEFLGRLKTKFEAGTLELA